MKREDMWSYERRGDFHQLASDDNGRKTHRERKVILTDDDDTRAIGTRTSRRRIGRRPGCPLVLSRPTEETQNDLTGERNSADSLARYGGG